MRRMLAALVPVSVLAAVAMPSAHAAMPAPGPVLFSVLAPSATVTTSAYSTSITVPASSPLVWFTDRPARKAGTDTVGGLARDWARYGFAAVPPNAAVVTSAGGTRRQQAVVLSRPRTEGPLVTFTMKPLKGSVLGMRGAPIPAGQYDGPTELFIDPSGGGTLPGYLVCTSQDGDKARAFYELRPVKIFPRLQTTYRAPPVYVDIDDAAGLQVYGFKVTDGYFDCIWG